MLMLACDSVCAGGPRNGAQQSWNAAGATVRAFRTASQQLKKDCVSGSSTRRRLSALKSQLRIETLLERPPTAHYAILRRCVSHLSA